MGADLRHRRREIAQAGQIGCAFGAKCDPSVCGIEAEPSIADKARCQQIKAKLRARPCGIDHDLGGMFDRLATLGEADFDIARGLGVDAGNRAARERDLAPFVQMMEHRDAIVGAAPKARL